jgi:hypothetical protein
MIFVLGFAYGMQISQTTKTMSETDWNAITEVKEISLKPIVGVIKEDANFLNDKITELSPNANNFAYQGPMLQEVVITNIDNTKTTATHFAKINAGVPRTFFRWIEMKPIPTRQVYLTVRQIVYPKFEVNPI